LLEFIDIITSQNLSKANLKALFLGILNLGKPFKDTEEMKTETNLTNAKMKTYDLSEDGRVTRNRQARGKENMRAKPCELPAAAGRNLNTCVCRHDLFNRKPTMYLTYPESRKKGGEYV
jgi:hypothetical protein